MTNKPRHTPVMDAAFLRTVLSYNADTGEFRRLSTGKIVGVHDDGYIKISIKKRYYYAHRLAWLYETGEWPAALVDHVNGQRNDNRFANLRQATNAQNLHNRGATVRNRSGTKGVCRTNRVRNPWRATIKVNGTYRYLGCFQTKEDAAAAYASAAVAMHREFARTQPFQNTGG